MTNSSEKPALSQRLTVTRTSKNAVLFAGFRIVRLSDNVTRECIRYADCGYGRRALIQKNGNVAVDGVGRIFDNPHDLLAQSRVAFALFRLKMVGREFWEAAEARCEEQLRSLDISKLMAEAERLGVSVMLKGNSAKEVRTK